MQQLGAWVTSEEAPKPRRGFRELLKVILGGLDREDPEVRPMGLRTRGERRTHSGASVFRLKTLQGAETS